ncbi:MAG TPA: hypothetical protein VFS97_13365 [Nitrososphaeraceae archaeon]|nr:hypothetical protein [Nitrososphaeraceae archaeon]
MDNNSIQQLENEKEQEVVGVGVPICGANLSTPVVDTVNYIWEVHYKIGTRLYIENAD